MKLQHLKKKRLPQLFIIYTRYLIGSAFVFASIVKIRGERFTAESGANNPIDSAWHLFETLYQSGMYWKFLGIAQCMAGLLLITQKYARLGAVAFLPIIANIYVMTISYDFHGTPIITGLMLLATILLLVWESDQLKILWNQTPDKQQSHTLEFHHGWQWTGLALLLLVATNSTGMKAIGPIAWISTAALIALGGGGYTCFQFHKSQ